MRFSYSVVLATALTLSATSLEAAPSPAEVAHMCDMQLKLQSPRFDALGATLSLTPKQKPVFEHWKQVMLAVAKDRGCVPPHMDYDLPTLKRIDLEETILRLALANMEKERPALAALYASLSPAQREKFEHPQIPGAMGGMPHKN